MRPWEEIWRQAPEPRRYDVVCGHEVMAKCGNINEPWAYERAQLVAAAPDMARLLLSLLRNYECGTKVDAQIETVLKKAGVL